MTTTRTVPARRRRSLTRALAALPLLLAAVTAATPAVAASPPATAAAVPVTPVLTPPMGWNSWNKFGCNINETLIRETADALVANGLDRAGYQYVNLD
ncbi:hypothetical protein VR45_39045, partial [Streptomyces sp. NRRL S-495]